MTALILRYKNYFWLLVSLLVAFAFRVYLLDGQSLWNDEGTSVAVSGLDLTAIMNGAAKDIHPPLYYFLLHFWMPLGGQTEFAVRFLSVIAGLLVVAVTYRLARFFFDQEVAILASFLSAFAPFQVYYAQEARMYIWVTLWTALSVFAMSRLLFRPADHPDAPPVENRDWAGTRSRWVTWLFYVAATTAALYTHYFGVTLVAFENVAFGIWLWFAARSDSSKPGIADSERKSVIVRAAGFWAAAQAVIGLVYLPWYLFAGNQLASWPSISEPFDLPTLLWRVLNVYSVGLSLDPSGAYLIAFAFGVLVLFGLLWTREWGENFGIILLALWLVIPIAVMYLVSLSRPAYNPKFLLLATPAFFMLAARGLSRIHPGVFAHNRHPIVELRSFRFFFFAIAVIASVGFIPSLRNYYADPQYARDDYRAILRYIDLNEREGDGILVDAPGQIEVVRYYHRGNQPFFLLPRMRPPIPEETRADVDQMLARVRRLYAIYWATNQSDPEGIVETRLAQQAFKADDKWYGNVRLAVYGVIPAPGAPVVLDTRWGGEFTLTAYTLEPHKVRAGDVLALTLNWRTDQTPATRYKVFVHLLDAADHVIAQRDGEPVADTRITTTWRAGEVVPDRYGILIEPDMPPGEYRIEIGMYRADDGTRLPVTAQNGSPLGDHLILETVTVW